MNLRRIEGDAPIGWRNSRLPDTTFAVARALGIALIAIGLWTMWVAIRAL